MKRFYKQIDGKNVIKTLKEIVIRRDGRVTYNPTEEMVLADGWVECVEPEPKPVPENILIARARIKKLNELRKYDGSSEVNDCIIVYQGNELHYWADKHERDALKSAIRDYIALGRTKYRLDLRNLGVSIWIPCEGLLGMLAHLEVYATDCYNKTTDHEFAIKALTTMEEIESYVFSDYPEKLRFEV